MIFILVSIIIPVLIYLFLPVYLQHLTGRPVASRRPLIAAGLIYFIAWYLPSPLIHGMDTGATTHFLGGGIFTGLIWVYLKHHLRWRAGWLLELLSLLALVSLLGVANELFELIAVETGLAHITLADTSWDLAANTLGALVFWVASRLWPKTRQH